MSAGSRFRSENLLEQFNYFKAHQELPVKEFGLGEVA